MVVFFNDTATTEIYTLSLHDALPISSGRRSRREVAHERHRAVRARMGDAGADPVPGRDDRGGDRDRKSTRLNSSHANISYAVFCLKKQKYLVPVLKRFFRVIPESLVL